MHSHHMCLSLLFIFLSCNFSYSSLGLVLTVRTTVNKILILLLREGGYAHKIMLRNVWALRKPSLLLLTLHMVLTSEFIIYIYTLLFWFGDWVLDLLNRVMLMNFGGR